MLRRNAALLPIYSLLLGLLALLGYCAIAAGIVTKDASTIVPLLFARFFPDWFAGIADAAIVIGALVAGGHHVHRRRKPLRKQRLS